MAFTRLAAALALFAAGAAAQQVLTMTTGKKLDVAPAYTFVSDVAGYLKVSNDVCEFDNALNQPTPNFAAAKKLYASGKNSKKSDGSIRTLKGLGTGDNSGEPFWDQYAKHFKSVTFVDDMVSKALDGVAPFKTTPLARREVARKGVSSNLIMAYLMHEMDEAAYKMGATPPEISDAKGAPHNVDEAFALYVGEKSECSPWGISNKRGTVFDTMDTCTASKANTAAVAAFNAALAAARKGDMKGFMAARAKVLSAFAVTSVQATIQYAEQMVANLAAKKPTDEYQAAPSRRPPLSRSRPRWRRPTRASASRRPTSAPTTAARTPPRPSAERSRACRCAKRRPARARRRPGPAPALPEAAGGRRAAAPSDPCTRALLYLLHAPSARRRRAPLLYENQPAPNT